MSVPEPNRWLLKEYVRGALEGIDVDKYWNSARQVLHGHVSNEEIQGDLESATFSYEIEDGVTNEEEQLPNLDRAITTLTVRGYKKTQWQQESEKSLRDHEAERLLQDSARAVLWNRGVGPGMQCNASRALIVSQKVSQEVSGWVGSEIVFNIYHDQGYIGL